MRYWLVKSEPEAYSWQQLLADGRTCWDGVRNYQARNHLRCMQLRDQVLFYHSQGPRQVVGIAEVVRSSYADPSAANPDAAAEKWSAVDLRPLSSLEQPVSLALIRSTPALREIALVRQARLSVMPLSSAEFACIVALGAGNRIRTDDLQLGKLSLYR